MNTQSLVLILLIALTHSICASQPAEIGAKRPAHTFFQEADQYFEQWDKDKDGVLSKKEIEMAVNNPRYQGEAAAAIAAIEHMVRSKDFILPALTKAYLISPDSRPPKAVKADDGNDDDSAKLDDKPGKSPFQRTYFGYWQKIAGTSHDLFPQSLPSFTAAHQGLLGDCPFVSTVGAMLYRNPEDVKRMITQNDNGSYTVRLGNGKTVKLHVTDADVAIWSSARSNGLWFTVLEKAYRHALVEAKRGKGEDGLTIYDKFGSVDTIPYLLGHRTHPIGDLKTVARDGKKLAQLQHELVNAMRDHRLVKAGTPGKRSTPGITPTHAYAVLGYDKKTDRVTVWNPHGNNFTPEGPEGLSNGYNTKRGKFEIPLREMLQIFSNIIFETNEPDQA